MIQLKRLVYVICCTNSSFNSFFQTIYKYTHFHLNKLASLCTYNYQTGFCFTESIDANFYSWKLLSITLDYYLSLFNFSRNPSKIKRGNRTSLPIHRPHSLNNRIRIIIKPFSHWKSIGVHLMNRRCISVILK